MYFSTESEHLIHDVALALLRFGILAQIKPVTQKSGHDAFTLHILGAEQQLLFLRHMGIREYSHKECQQHCQRLEKTLLQSSC